MDFRELNKKEIGSRIRARREALNMSREALARELSVSAKFIAAVEYGDRGLSIENLYKLKQLFGVSMDFIVEGDDAVSIDEDKRRALNENILGSLSVCSDVQLGCMEKIARLYVEGVVNKD